MTRTFSTFFPYTLSQQQTRIRLAVAASTPLLSFGHKQHSSDTKRKSKKRSVKKKNHQALVAPSGFSFLSCVIRCPSTGFSSAKTPLLPHHSLIPSSCENPQGISLFLPASVYNHILYTIHTHCTPFNRLGAVMAGHVLCRRTSWYIPYVRAVAI